MNVLVTGADGFIGSPCSAIGAVRSSGPCFLLL